MRAKGAAGPLAWIIALAVTLPLESLSFAAPQAPSRLEVFVAEGCPHCAAAERFLERLRRERPGLEVRVLEVTTDAAARERLFELARARSVSPVAVPAFLVGDELLVGWDEGGRAEATLRALLGAPAPGGASLPRPSPSVALPLIGPVTADGVSLPVFSFVVGFLDGVNPCAMWALLYLLTLLVTLGDRRKMLILGGTFVAVGGALYFLFIAAWLELFLLVGLSRPLRLVIGGAAALVGMVHVKDFFAPGRGVSLSIPAAAKPRIYQRARRILTAENLWGAIAAVAVLAVLVNLVEVLCTAGLPAVYTQVLASRDLARLEYYGNLGVYVAAYVLDDALVLGVTVATLSRTRLQERGGRVLKLLSGAVLLLLGLALVFRPDWLV
jgi:glutaredoxin